MINNRPNSARIYELGLSVSEPVGLLPSLSQWKIAYYGTNTDDYDLFFLRNHSSKLTLCKR